MLPTNHLAAFLLTIYVLILVPGPSVLFVVSRGVALGRRAALATVFGNTGGLALQGALVCAGLGTLLAKSDAVYTTLKLIGAAYLIVLGIRTIRDRGHLADALGGLNMEPRSVPRILREGFVVGSTNPKGLLIFTAVLPQFIEPARGHPSLQLATLTAICCVIAILSDGTWALASGTARQWFGRSPRRLRGMSAVGGATMMALGVALALTGRKR
ncbi:MAG TPA: LysE family translocator [Solirubrobacteraceae bacterium]|jgi:threonine/homoserine/homoserine lactone efflux protein|nr:LysE family translocator [Solirubrobacteraceae bacterium]